MKRHSWEIVDHVCRVCLGRVLRRVDDEGGIHVVCSNCGLEGTGSHRAICACGIDGRASKEGKLQCAANPNPNPVFPAQIIVSEKR